MVVALGSEEIGAFVAEALRLRPFGPTLRACPGLDPGVNG